MVFKLKTSKETMKIFEEIASVVRLQPFALCKIAIALSLHSDEPISNATFPKNSDGLELNRQTITGEYDELFKALVISYTGHALTDEEYFPGQLKAHIDRGAALLYSEYKYSNGNFYKHLLELDKGI